MKFELDPLPYALDELEPHISGDTVDTHYNKHHRGYLKKLAEQIEGKALGDLPLDEILRHDRIDTEIFRNAAQVWNHTFYWNSLAPDGGGKPDGTIAGLLERDFGGVDEFKQAFAEAALSEFGSGWAWLVSDWSGRLRVTSTSDADNPMLKDYTPLLVLDVWEHAYYLDYRNERAKYVQACLDHLLNWQFAESNIVITAAENSSIAEAGKLQLAQ